MKFTSYLIETHKIAKQLNENKYEFVLQKVIDAVDNGHVDYSESKIAFDIGDMSDSPELRGLKLVIRPSQKDGIQLGRDRDGNYAIVINTTEKLPNRQEIDSFLASKPIYAGFRKAYETYVKNHHDRNKEYEPNDTQKRMKANTRDEFESAYTQLVDAVREQHEKYKSAVAEIDKELNRVANVGRKKTLELAKDNLRDEYLGKDSNEFVSKIMKLPQAEFTKNLEKVWKEKLESRLGNYYTSNYGR